MIAYNSDDYKQALSLREQILKKPLGLVFSEELAEEKDYIHIAGYLEKELCTTAVLVPEVRIAKMQRVVVKEKLQRQGIGSALVAFCEEYAKNNSFKLIYCYSRIEVILFYMKNGFQICGEITFKNNTPYQKMQKFIND